MCSSAKWYSFLEIHTRGFLTLNRHGPQVQPDTVAALEAYPEFHKQAQSANAPAGYAPTFTDLNASVSANTYLGLQTLKSYDVNLCAEYCNNKTLCTGFNIFIERDPSLNPSDNCTLPASIANYKCTLWGSGVDTASATNYGQTRPIPSRHRRLRRLRKDQHHHPPSQLQPGWQPPTKCGDGSKGHNHPSTCIGTGFFPGPYNPSLCAAYAEAQNVVNKKSPFWYNWIQFWTGMYNPYKCDFFNTVVIC